MNLYSVYILPIKIHSISYNSNIYIYIYKFRNFNNRFLYAKQNNNRFLIGVGFKILKLKCMLHVLLKYLLLLYFKKLIKTNKSLSLSIETFIHIACFVKIFIVTLLKEISIN